MGKEYYKLYILQCDRKLSGCDDEIIMKLDRADHESEAEEYCLEQGWAINNDEILCPSCNNKSRFKVI